MRNIICFALLALINSGLADVFYDPFSRPANMQSAAKNNAYSVFQGTDLKIDMLMLAPDKKDSFFVSDGKVYKVGDYFGSNQIMDIKNFSVTLWNGVLSFDIPVTEDISGDMQITETAG
ncbi:MAG: hypothetical protein K0S08_578 [Gammaproteobacteria bacterium]|jgi:hypothetical protein|nr:hypothetical protein [Gammaproteobacteria bacterium]